MIVSMFSIILLIIFICLSYIPVNSAHCVDIHHHIVSQGLHYVPGPNPCTLCICEKGTPKWCKQVLCSPPQNCKSFEVGNSCCEFKCLDDILSKTDTYNETYDLALRLIASAVTAVLSLSLLFFLIHRLRQRKIRLRRQNRQLNEDQRSLNSIGYITGSLGYLPGSIGYLGSASNEIEFHYEECNVQYPLWKPPGNYFPRGEAPPPYEEAIRSARSEVEIVNSQQHNHNHNNNQVNTTPFTFSSNRNENVSLTLVHNTHVSITPNMQQNGIASSQCNVLLHQSNNVQSLQVDGNGTNGNGGASIKNDTAADTHSHTQQNTSVSLACTSGGSGATLESQVDVHYENYNHNSSVAAPIVTVNMKNDESLPKQSLNIDYLHNRGTYASIGNKQIEVKNEPISVLSCSSSWKKEASHYSAAVSTPANTNKITPTDYKQKITDTSKNSKMIDSPSYAPGSSKSYRYENQFVDSKIKKCNMLKEATRSNKVVASRVYDKQKSDNMVSKIHNNDTHDILLQETSKHRTIPQKYTKLVNSDLCYVNMSELGRRKDDDFSEHCDMILKQHNIDKIRYAAEKLDKKNSEKSLNASIRNSLCASSELRNTQKSTVNSSVGLIKGDMSTHRTLPKNLRELSEAFYFNFDSSTCENSNLECLKKKTIFRSTGLQSDTTNASASSEKEVKNNDTAHSINTLGRKQTVQKPNNNSMTNNNVNTSCYRNMITLTNQITNLIPNQTETPKSSIEKADVIPEQNVEKEKSCLSYRCSSPPQDDVDDYRSECENCKSLSFEDCNDEEGDILNETMTLQRRPIEQGEEHSFYRTSHTLPTHTKKTTRSVPLNIQRESWFMAMQEMTSSSESD